MRQDHSLRAISIALFAATLVPATRAQATLRPLPEVARLWGSVDRPLLESDPQLDRPVEAAFDLDFSAPLTTPTTASELQGSGLDLRLKRHFLDVDFHALVLDAARFSDAPGELSTQRGGWKAAFGQYSPGAASFAFALGTEASIYDFGGGPSPLAGVTDPLNDVYDTSFSARFLVEASERLSCYGGAQFGLAGEDLVSPADSVYVGAAIALRYRAADEFALLAGIAGQSRFEDSAWVLPYIGFDWQISDSLRLVTEAAEVNLDWRASEDWTLGATLAYDFRQYRLNDEGSLHGGALHDEEIRLGASLGWQPREGMKFSLEVGTLLWRELSFTDGQSGLRTEAESESPFYLRAGLSLSF